MDPDRSSMIDSLSHSSLFSLCIPVGTQRPEQEVEEPGPVSP